MNKTYLTLTLLATLMALSSAQVFSIGTCPDNLQVVPDFSVDKYLGKWYEYAKYPVYFEANGKCISAQYSLNDNGDSVKVKNALINENTNAYSDILGSATVVANAKLLVKFPVSPLITVSSNYWILDTDYDNYSVVYSCVPLTSETYATTVWILTRQALPNADVVEKAISVLKNNNISLNELKITNQISCNEAENYHENEDEDEDNEEKDE